MLFSNIMPVICKNPKCRYFFHKLRKPSFETSSVLLPFITMTFCHVVIFLCFVAILFGIETMSSITNVIITIGIDSIYPRIMENITYYDNCRYRKQAIIDQYYCTSYHTSYHGLNKLLAD